MTGRQRLTDILHRRKQHPGVCWTTLIDGPTRRNMSPTLRQMGVFDFYRHVGCDILTFGNHGLPPELRVPQPYVTRTDVRVEQEVHPDGTVVTRRITPVGVLLGEACDGHPTRYPVQSRADLLTLIALWRSAQTEACDNRAAFAAVEAALGDDGMFLPTVPPSPVQQLLEYETGPEHFYYLLQDHPEEMQELLDVMHAVRRREYALLAEQHPAGAVMAVENTSSALISPEHYARYSVPQLRAYADLLHETGKKYVLHMCGHLAALLPDIARTGLDAINAATPPPTGSTPLESILDAYGDDFCLLGGLFDPTLMHAPSATRRQFHDYLDQLYTPRLRRANLCLWIGVDGVPTDLERFAWVNQWMQAQR